LLFSFSPFWHIRSGILLIVVLSQVFNYVLTSLALWGWLASECTEAIILSALDENGNLQQLCPDCLLLDMLQQSLMCGTPFPIPPPVERPFAKVVLRSLLQKEDNKVLTNWKSQV
jgi:hypothetical protein